MRTKNSRPDARNIAVERVIVYLYEHGIMDRVRLIQFCEKGAIPNDSVKMDTRDKEKRIGLSTINWALSTLHEDRIITKLKSEDGQSKRYSLFRKWRHNHRVWVQDLRKRVSGLPDSRFLSTVYDTPRSNIDLQILPEIEGTRTTATTVEYCVSRY